ncbi:hypothetical protein AVEN_142749-1 [Araneus ventricosus]|uniref:Uncharacterized protein n=1 Tax=Araneus ventricosus TaxID=182803 RepID=A0A4Y2QY32_ARAVE|nr:hypothetical protein AVEN_142749-1 [Araneus ventricosus]
MYTDFTEKIEHVSRYVQRKSPSPLLFLNGVSLIRARRKALLCLVLKTKVKPTVYFHAISNEHDCCVRNRLQDRRRSATSLRSALISSRSNSIVERCSFIDEGSPPPPEETDWIKFGFCLSPQLPYPK